MRKAPLRAFQSSSIVPAIAEKVNGKSAGPGEGMTIRE